MKFNRNNVKQRGVGIIEVLVALVVVSIGVLGMAALQLKGMQHSTAGYNRSKALMMAENMATLMRINQVGIDAGHYESFDSNSVNCATQPATYCQATDSSAGAAAACTVEQLAEFDFFSVACGDWGNGGTATGVKQSLPMGRIAVACEDAPCAPDSTYHIRVTWIEGGGRATRLNDTVQREVQMRMRP